MSSARLIQRPQCRQRIMNCSFRGRLSPRRKTPSVTSIPQAKGVVISLCSRAELTRMRSRQVRRGKSERRSAIWFCSEIHKAGRSANARSRSSLEWYKSRRLFRDPRTTTKETITDRSERILMKCRSASTAIRRATSEMTTQREELASACCARWASPRTVER